MWTWLTWIWQYLKDHDAPNWFSIFFSLFIWPSILAVIFYWWAHRRKQSVPHFLVTFMPSQINIGQQSFDAVTLTFINQTGSIAYLSRARLIEVPKRFPVPIAASKDMARAWRELVFAVPPNQVFDKYECILQTDGRVSAVIATTHPLADSFYSYRPGWLRKLFRCPKYFRLEYTIVVADRKFSVATIY